MKRFPATLRLSTAISLAVALTTMACDGDRAAVFDPVPDTSDAGTSSTRDSGTSSPDADGGGGGGTRCKGTGECDDGIACTTDVCENGVCRHLLTSGAGPAACPVGQYCDPAKGCVPGVACADDTQCQQKLGDDPCKANVYCNQPTATCQFSILDKDGDGFPPLACGGNDCNDLDPYVHGFQHEVCDGKDNDCDGAIDEEAVCVTGCDIASCPKPSSAELSQCCTAEGACGFKVQTGPCEEVPDDSCGLASCPEPTYPGFMKCCNSDHGCGFKNGPSGFCYDAGGSGGGGSGGGMP